MIITATEPPAEAGLEESAGLRSASVWRAGHDMACRAETDSLAEEVPVALQFNGISHATVLATPADLVDLAYGFSYTEGIVRDAGDIYDVEIVTEDRGIVLELTIASACLNELKLRRRSLAGRTGCGLCGIESLDEVRRKLSPLLARPAGFSAPAIVRAVDQLRARQPMHLASGATHAAGWADMQGAIQQLREDVGRHNALDKLIGHLLRQAIDPAEGLAVISSRASFEMVQKAVAARINALIAVSAPTTYAVEIATELNVLLAGFARQQHFTVYSHPEFLDGTGSPA